MLIIFCLLTLAILSFFIGHLFPYLQVMSIILALAKTSNASYNSVVNFVPCVHRVRCGDSLDNTVEKNSSSFP